MRDLIQVTHDNSTTPTLIYQFFVYRRIIDNVLELDEESLDINLTGNHLELKFTDGVLLPMVYIFETHTQISVLAATSNSVHRIVFPHPDRLRRHVSLPLFILLLYVNLK